MTSLAGRRVIVTGGSKGLGRRMVEALVAEGARVAIFARPSDELDKVQGVLGSAALACPCDVASPDQVGAAVAKAVGALGGLDTLVNNAAMTGLGRVEDASDDAVRREVETNLMGPIWTMREAAPHLRRSRGHIVNVSSEAVLQHPPYLALYAATKAALESLSTGIKRELAPDVRVTVLRLGRMRESSLYQGWDKALEEPFMAAIKRFGMNADNGAAMTPASVAAALVQILALPEEVSSDLVVLRGRIR